MVVYGGVLLSVWVGVCMSFNWQTEDEAAWAALAVTDVKPTAVLRRWWLGMLVLGVLGSLGWLVYGEVDSRLQVTVTAVTADVLATHGLVQRAYVTGDAELFGTLISGRDPQWGETQTTLLSSALLFERAAFGLQLLKVLPDEPTTTVMPNLSEAEVQSRWLYEVQRGMGVTETVVLSQTAIYRAGSQQWLYAPPDSAFWGEWQTLSTNYLHLTFPARDARIVERLAVDLDGVVEMVCKRYTTLACEAGMFVQVRFGNDPAVLLQGAGVNGDVVHETHLTLPSPTLMGIPLDEQGYEAWLRGYASRLAAAVIEQRMQYDCCQQQVLWQALLDKQLETLGLQPWPLETVDYAEAFIRFAPTSALLNAWYGRVDEVEVHLVYTLVDFLTTAEEGTVSLSEMQRALLASHSPTEWLDEIVSAPYKGDSYQLEQAWLHFLYEASLALPVEVPAIAWPEQRIEITCRTEMGLVNRLYDFQKNEWQPVSATAQGEVVLTLPGRGGQLTFQSDRGVLFEADGRSWLVSQPMTDSLGVGNHLNVLALDATGQQVVVEEIDFTRRWGRERYWRFSPTACRQGSCELVPLAGRPIWSPDGKYTLLAVVTVDEESVAERLFLPWTYDLYLGDSWGRPQKKVGQGGIPFWLDDEHYGFTGLTGGNDFALMVGEREGKAEPVLYLSDLADTFAIEANVPLALRGHVYPQQSHTLLLVVQSSFQSPVVYEEGTDYFLKVVLDPATYQPETTTLLFRKGGLR